MILLKRVRTLNLRLTNFLACIYAMVGCLHHLVKRAIRLFYEHLAGQLWQDEAETGENHWESF
jgi:hypothetical protein